MPRVPRVAFFPDSYHEVNGVAHTARQFTAWAGRTGKPFLCVCAGSGALQRTQRDSVETLQLPRGAASFALDKDLRYDPFFLRHASAIQRALRAFRPDILHITGPSELGMLGAALAHKLGIPLAASWHTNVHEYAARRSGWALRLLPPSQRAAAARAIEQTALRAAALFYRSARILFAPNPELCTLLAAATGRPCLLMTRGINAELFSPGHRTTPSPVTSGVWTLGYVGRLSIEKNVALLPRIAQELRTLGFSDGRDGASPRLRFLIVGQGAEEASLRAQLPGAGFPGVLRGPALAEAYSNMDCFLFPSHTDTFGNVVLEAMACGVPAIVTPDGGPAHIVRSSGSVPGNVSGGGGLVAADEQFAAAVASLITDPEKHARMRQHARSYAASASWDAVFEGVYAAYAQALP